MAKRKQNDQRGDKANSKKASDGQMDNTENSESVEGGATGDQGRVEATRLPIVAIGSSAGGLEALQEFFSNVPPDSGIAFVVVTHIRPGRESMLPELLSSVTTMEIIHAGDSTRIEPNKIIIARDSLLSISKGVLQPVKSDRPEVEYDHIDHFIRPLAHDQPEHAIGIIL